MGAYKKYLKAQSMMVAVVGDQSETEAISFAKKIYTAFDHGQIDDTLKHPVLSVAKATYTQEYNFENAFVDVTMPCPGTNDPDYIVIKVIDALLQYGDNRLHHATRIQRDLAYYAIDYEIQDLGYDFFINGTSIMKKVQPQDIQRVAAKYFSARDITISVPSAEVERIMPE